MRRWAPSLPKNRETMSAMLGGPSTFQYYMHDWEIPHFLLQQ